MRTIFFSVMLLLFAVSDAAAQQTAQSDELIGTWKGSSICQVPGSPCHDETVVYHITRINQADSFNIHMNKIVQGVEEDMGDLPGTYVASKLRFSSTAYRASWSFHVKGNVLEGTLYVGNQLYRIIKVERQP